MSSEQVASKKSATAVPGLDVAALDGWLRANTPELVGAAPLTAVLIAGGRSNLTYSLRGTTQPLVLRRPPLGHVQRTAHDMAREFRVISALRSTPVHVPRPIRLVDDSSAGVEVPFYLMEQVPGRILRSRADNTGYSPEAIGALSRELIETLAELHTTDPVSVGLDDFGRAEGFLERQLDRWSRQLDGSRSRGVSELDALQAALGTGIPTNSRAAIVHGDYRLDNAVVRDEGGRPRIGAILDWEMSTLGDPLTDLGLFGLYWSIGSLDGAPDAGIPTSVSAADGYPGFDELVDVYAAATGMPVPELPWYQAFAAYKLAVILEGIHFRFQAGQTVGDGFESIGALVTPLALAGHRYLKGS